MARDKGYPPEGTRARVHRFRDSVAVSVGDGPTTYLPTKQAVKLALELMKCATDVDEVAFEYSQYPTTVIER